MICFLINFYNMHAALYQSLSMKCVFMRERLTQDELQIISKLNKEFQFHKSTKLYRDCYNLYYTFLCTKSRNNGSKLTIIKDPGLYFKNVSARFSTRKFLTK